MPKFNIYEQLSYIMVGFIAVLIFVFNSLIFGFYFFVPGLTLENSLIWLLVVYFIGHLIQSLANIFTKIKGVNYFIPENKETRTDYQEKVLKEIEEKYNLPEKSFKESWEICYLFSLSKDATGQIMQLNSQYGMYRGWVLVFLFNSIFYIYHMVFCRLTPFLFLLSIISILVSLVFRERAKRIWHYIGIKVFATYSLYTKN